MRGAKMDTYGTTALDGTDGGRRVRLLPDAVVNKIAAGEVVERPASVLRELLDNALDAGARHVRVEVSDGGRRLVRVCDDGKGMDRDDALMSIERHATSKLRSFDDLDSLATMGFRGEALAAISAVSQFTLTTNRAGSAAGTELVVFGGRVQEVREAGAPTGTDVAVRNLFFNVPARRKFLRSAQTEFAHVRHQFFLSALTRPDVEFVLAADGEEVNRLRATDDLRERVRDFHGDAVADALRPVSHGDGVTEIGGYAGAPPYSRNDRELQVALVNGRAAWSPILGYAVQTAYRDILPAGRYAPLFLTIALPQNLVDINVHPAKKEVRFRRPTEVRDVLVEAIRGAVKGGRGPTGRKFGPGEWRREGADGAGPASGPAAAHGTVSPPGEAPFKLEAAPPPVRTVQGTLDLRPQAAAPGSGDGAGETGGGAAAPSAGAGAPTAPWKAYRLLGRLSGGYWVMETADGMVLMDPRAVHERILFEKWMASIRGGTVPRQGLLPPVTVTLTPLQSNALRHSLKWLGEYGYGVAEFGRDAWMLDAVPAWISGGEPAGVLSDLADWLAKNGKSPSSSPDWLASFVANAVARRAVRSEEVADEAAARRLLEGLAATEMPYASPRGRPTLVLTSWRELDRKFGREG